MKIYSETGFLIIIDPAYLKLADHTAIAVIDFLKKPSYAGRLLENSLFPDAYGGLVGHVKLKDGPGMYDFDPDKVQFWDVDTKGNKIIFGVDKGSFILFDVKYIQPLIKNFDGKEFDSNNNPEYFLQLQQKISNRYNILLWCPSPLPFAEGWHEVSASAFQLSN